MNYQWQEDRMKTILEGYESPVGFRSSFKGVPILMYEDMKHYIDYTKYFVMFRGPRPSRAQSSTRKRDAKAFDVYRKSDHQVKLNRLEHEAFHRGVRWANNRSH